MNRLKISFSIDRQPLMDTLKSTNSNLNRFVSNETLIEHSPTSKNIKIYQKLQKQAKSVYNGLHARLTCTAPPHSHQCAVMVDWSEYPNSLHSPSLKLLVGDPSNRKQLRCSVEMDSTPEVVVSEQATSWDSYDVQLRSREWRGKLVEAAKSHSVGIATVSAMATMLDPKNPHIEKIWQERENRKLKSKKASQLHAPKVKSSHRLSISGLARKSKKTSRSVTRISMTSRSNQSTRSAVDQPPSTSNGAGTTIPAAGSVSESGKDTDTQPASLPAKKPVRFNEADSPPPTNNVDREDSILIADVCAFLANRNLQPTREHLKHEQARLHFELDPPDQTMLQTATMTDLKTIFTTLPRLPDRLRLGIKLIRTFLSFGTSGWIPQDWDRHNVRILGPHAAAQGPLHPYISHAAFCKAAPLALTEDQTRSFFFGLGVILLELADSKTLEQTEVWKKVSTTDLQPAWLLMCAAGDWYEQLKCRHDETLSEPIRRCLKYGFANRANLDDGAFLAEVADGVLKPLESFVSRWGIAPR